MAFYESPRFPDALAVDAQPAFGTAGGPGFATLLSESPGGHELRTARILQDLETWEIGLQVKDVATTQALIAFFNAIAKGRANIFRFRAPGADGHSGSDEYLGTGDGAEDTFQLQ